MNIKNILFVIVIACLFEIFSRYGHIIFPYEDHQRYGYTQNKKSFITSPFQKINGRGAIGDLFKGEKKSIALFGTSALFDGVPMDKTWPKLLTKLSNNSVHIDNFSFFGESIKTLNKKLKSLCKLKRFYALSIIQISHTDLTEEIYTPGYRDRFTPKKKGGFKTFQQIKKWHSRSQNNQFFNFFKKKPFYHTYNLEEITTLKRARKMLLQNVFINDTIKIDKKLINEISPLVEEVIKSSFCISKTVFWLSEPFAWSKNMLRSYDNIYYHLEEIYTRNQPLFASNKSLGLYMEEQKELIKNIVQKKTKDIIFIDLFSLIQKEISSNPDLFIDESHLSEKGHRFIFQFLFPILVKYVHEFK